VSRKRNPAEKKADAYSQEWRARSRVTQSGLRVGRPRRKAGINRANRRIAHNQLAVTADDDVDLVIPERPPWRRWHNPVRLDAWVSSRITGRRDRSGWNYFKQPYDSVHHRARFVAFLGSLVQTRGDEARELAVVWQERLHGRYARDPWLEPFFVDEPAWRDRLDEWVTRWTTDTSSSD
jgi:hypothetical protein